MDNLSERFDAVTAKAEEREKTIERVLNLVDKAEDLLKRQREKILHQEKMLQRRDEEIRRLRRLLVLSKKQ